jgi:ammonia channel protein AmtB
LALTTAAVAVGYFNPATTSFFPVCPFHALTGLNCPGCGLTRGFHALFQGDILTALHFNALMPVYLLLFLYLFASLGLVLISGRGLEFRKFSPRIIYGFLVLTLVFGVIRNLPFYPFSLIAI